MSAPAAAAKTGLKCVLALGGKEPGTINGNLLLDKLFGAEIIWTGGYRKGEKIPEITEELKSRGLNPYVIPYGGSNVIGVLGFIDALWELKAQLNKSGQKIDTIIFASSSGGTHAGLLLANYMFDNPFRLIGIGVDKEEIDRKILTVLKDQRLRKELREKAVKIAGRFSWKKSAERTLKIYKKIYER